MLPLVFCYLLNSVLVAESAYLKAGALSAHLDRVTRIDNVLWVQYPSTAVNGIPDRLGTITEELTTTPLQLEQDLLQEVGGSGKFLRLLHARVELVNKTLTPALDNYHGFPLSHRHKRGLTDGLGHLSDMIFRTSMNENVEEFID